MFFSFAKLSCISTKLSKEGTEEYMTFSEMLAAYKEHGLAVIAEEPTEEEFNDKWLVFPWEKKMKT